ncbi:threonine ammonia-lyase [Pseudoclavibacter chungangensis]|uniref:L-threonine dehydratase catabolic TdcB n=1 Tax=Pseudoclavibacter chungangensis TaxID=587635 RepID=A0A7J5BWK6_9MICO|nr:threonine ammonia-lyase [Pseudoclavibacter chungangensis]KAB1657931.1 threonine ammonia-lyase [Pseudoclavibacter chungangensis]NYJ65919.1 threonine dehydratase [Pseudoclavibacter chungangensis]
MTSTIPELELIEAAREIVNRVITSTPMDSARFLTDELGSPVFLKCENMQRTGSYKIRGATYRLSRLSDEQRERGVVAASAGNHAQGVAFAARELGIAATIFMPVGVPLPKLQATRGYGADVVLTGNNVAEALEAAKRFAAETGAEFIHPYDHIDVITGQATLALDVFDQLPDVDTIIVPIGGGGLISGVASAAIRHEEATGHHVRVIGVQAANSAPFPISVEAGRPVKISADPTIADGIAVDRPGDLTFEYVRDLVDDIVTVSEDDISRAILLLIERAKLVVEPAGATGVAAILAGRVVAAGKTVVVLSGGNIDPLMLEKVISTGLTASDRYMKMVIGLPDVPGQLATISRILAEVNANVIEVLHTRHNKGLQVTEVELEVSVETRGTEHARLVIEALRAAGYEPKLRRGETFVP